MFIQKKQNLKRYTYLCLSLSSIVISSEIQARDIFSKDGIDHPINGGYISVPRLGKSIAGKLEESNLIGPNSKTFKNSENNIQKDLKSPPMGEGMQNSSHKYSKLKNEIIDKYEKQKPELVRFRNSSSSKPHTPGLAAQARQLRLLSETLNKEAEENNKKVTDLGKGVVDIADTLAETTIENGVKNQEIKSMLIIIKNEIKEKIIYFFNK